MIDFNFPTLEKGKPIKPISITMDEFDAALIRKGLKTSHRVPVHFFDPRPYYNATKDLFSERIEKINNFRYAIFSTFPDIEYRKIYSYPGLKKRGYAYVREPHCKIVPKGVEENASLKDLLKQPRHLFKSIEEHDDIGKANKLKWRHPKFTKWWMENCIILHVNDVRLERLHSADEDLLIREGYAMAYDESTESVNETRYSIVGDQIYDNGYYPESSFTSGLRNYWDAKYGEGSYDDDPLTWVINFEMCDEQL